jgi:hypothetical protein
MEFTKELDLCMEGISAKALSRAIVQRHVTFSSCHFPISAKPN